MAFCFVRVVLEAPIDNHFDYRYQPMEGDGASPIIGQIVSVPFGRRTVAGIITGVAEQTDVPANRIRDVEYLYQEIPPLAPSWLDLCRFAARYYHRSMGEVAVNALPKMLRQSKQTSVKRALKALEKQQKAREKEQVDKPADTMPVLNDAQQHSLDTIMQSQGFASILLFGVTGSGKTEVYLRAVAEKLQQHPDGQVLMMVPEINLTPQLESRVRLRFPNENIVSLHSGLTEGERLQNWLSAVSGKARIILGTRLSIMVPAPNLKMIVVDEEHDQSYKQQEGLRYSARDLAVWRANQLRIPVVLGSATPSLESWHHIQKGHYQRIDLPERAVEQAVHPTVSLIDTGCERIGDGLTQPLIQAIQRRLDKKEVTLLFLNRRGYAPVLSCDACGWISACHRCSAYMVFHKAGRVLRCHHCGLERTIPRNCPDCGNLDLQVLGRGTQRIEEGLRSQFPDARVLRIDADSTSRKGTLQAALDSVHRGDVDIVIGTQMISKGHDFQNLTLVGVLDPDTALFSHDYRAGERLFAQLMQVAGRAGRSTAKSDANPAEVMIQTRYPTHPLYQAMLRRRYEYYVQELMAEREMAGFPPFGYQALLTAEARDIDKALQFLNQAKAMIAGNRAVTVSDAIPMAIMRVANVERAQLLVESASRPMLQSVLSAWIPQLKAQKTRVKWSIEVDPMSI